MDAPSQCLCCVRAGLGQVGLVGQKVKWDDEASTDLGLQGKQGLSWGCEEGKAAAPLSVLSHTDSTELQQSLETATLEPCSALAGWLTRSLR